MSTLLTQLLEALSTGELRVVDLTQPLSAKTPVIGLPEVFAPSPGFSKEVISRYDDPGPMWYWNALHLGEHSGTHFDAPIHWVTGKDIPNNTCETIPAGQFIGPACVFDASQQTVSDEDFLLTADHIIEWEAQHGQIPPQSWFLLRTDWSKRTDPEVFLNVSEDGPHNPGFHPSASRFLADTRDVLGVGVETVGTDAGQAATLDPPFPSHNIMHGAGKFGLASLCNLDQLPPTGAMLVAAPLKIVEGSGSPLRVLAIAPK